MTQHKYQEVNGIRKYNPAYVVPPSAPAAAVPFINQSTALPVIAVPVAAVVADNNGGGEDEEISYTPTATYEAAVATYHEDEEEIYVGGYQGNGDSLDRLNSVLSKYEVPGGMLAKLLEVKQFSLIEIILDDSGSMGRLTDALDPITNKKMTRWIEAKWRISQMIELLAYVVAPPIKIYFLNRTDIVTIEKNSTELPSDYIQRAESVLLQTFSINPSGSTPALQAIQASLNRNRDQKVIRFFMGDGMPNGGQTTIKKITDMIIHRHAPSFNPFTFMSCTNEDDQVEWMKTTEEKAPFCAEFDDYQDESREVLQDQGKAFPYSFGLHLVAQIVAAFNPHDLDAMDESLPFTKQVLDNLLGYQSSPEEYRYYFDCFIEAQKKLPLKRFQHDFVRQLPTLYSQFLTVSVATDIPAAARYKQQVKQASSKPGYIASGGAGAVRSKGATSTPSPSQDECCIIL